MPTTEIVTIKNNPISDDWDIVGANVFSALSTDNGDSSYISATFGTHDINNIEFEFSPPAGASFISLLLQAKCRRTFDSGNLIIWRDDDHNKGTQDEINCPPSYGFLTRTISTAADAGMSPFPADATILMALRGDGGEAEVRVTYVRAVLTYNSLPNAPTSLSPANGATVGTLSPVFTGTRSDPDNDNMTAYQLEVRRNSDDALMWSSGDQTSGISGANFSRVYGGSTLVNGTVYKWRARTKEAAGYGAWSSYLTFTPSINTTPTASLTSPSDAAQVGTLTPTLAFTFNDPDGGTNGEYAHRQILVERVSDGASMWDTGQVATSPTEKTNRASSVVYAGSALSGSVVYRWRVRVWDGAGAVSDYTGYRTFTPVTAPNAPTLSSPTGPTNTLTPTIQGAYSQGTGGTEAAFQYEVRQGAATIYQSGDVATAIATGQAYGTDNASDTPATPPALAWGTSYSVRARSKDNLGAYSDWSSYLPFTTNAAPTTPTGLTPNGGITGDTTPTFNWTHNDPDGDAQTQAEIELRKVSDDSVVTGYGPKTLTQSTTTHDVTETLVASPATEYKWRVRTKGLAGPGFGPWSAYVTFNVADAPTLTVSEPDVDEVYTSPAPTIEWTFSGGSGTQATYRVRIYTDDQSTIVYDSGVLSGAAVSHAVPSTAGLRNGEAYFVRLTATDTLAQTADSGFIPVTVSFTPPAQLTGFTAVVIGGQQ